MLIISKSIHVNRFWSRISVDRNESYISRNKYSKHINIGNIQNIFM